MYGHAFRSRRALRALATGSLTAFCGLALVQSASAQSFPTQYAVQNISPSLSYNGTNPFYIRGGTLGNDGSVLVDAFYYSTQFGGNWVESIWSNGWSDSWADSELVANGLNNSGQCTGYLVSSGSQRLAMIGTPRQGSYKDLGFETNLFWYSMGTAINDYGDVVGTSQDFNQAYTFVYAPRIFHSPYVGTPVLTFNTLGSGIATPSAVNNNGLMVGSYPTNTTTLSGNKLPHAIAGVYGSQMHSVLINGHYSFYWNYFAHLTDLTPSSGFASWAKAVNNHNQILVTEEDIDSGDAQTYIYNYNPSTETVTSQIPLTSTYGDDAGAAINDSGISVGSGAYPSGYGTAVIYDTNGTGYDLNNYILSNSLAQGARLTKAISINNSGQILAFDGNSDVNVNLYLLTPIVPQSLTISSPTVTGGKSVTGTVTLNYAAKVKTVVHLSSSNTAAATVPATVTIAAGKNSALFTITAHTVAQPTSVTIQASYANTNVQTSLTVNPPSKVNTLLSVSSVSGTKGQTVTLKATLKKASNGAVLTNEPVSFTVNGVSVGLPVNTNLSGVASDSYTIPSSLASGKYTIKASFAGDSADNASTGTGTLTVN